MDKSAADLRMLDIRKAYLQVRVHPDLFRYQTVLLRDKIYVLERMGFGLSIAPKVMDTIVKFVLRDYPNMDNYLDDIITPSDTVDSVAAALEGYGLSTKPAEELTSSRVLGLQI